MMLILLLLQLNLPGPPPELETEPSTYTHDFKKVFHDTRNADLLFEFEDGSQSISAHKIVFVADSICF